VFEPSSAPRSLMAQDLSRRLVLLNDQIAGMGAEISSTDRDPATLQSARMQLRDFSAKGVLLGELHGQVEMADASSLMGKSYRK
jgi:hypothetical protein